jgi:hypothetical protein
MIYLTVGKLDIITHTTAQKKAAGSGRIPCTECLARKLARSAHASGPAFACLFSSLTGAARKRMWN